MELSEEKIWLYGLFVACPQGTPLLNCPLKKFRSLPDLDKWNALNKLTNEETHDIISHHNKCLLRRV